MNRRLRKYEFDSEYICLKSTKVYKKSSILLLNYLNGSIHNVFPHKNQSKLIEIKKISNSNPSLLSYMDNK